MMKRSGTTKRPRKQHTIDERIHIIRQFDDEFHKGEGGIALARRLGTTISTIYRWKRDVVITAASEDPENIESISLQEAMIAIFDDEQTAKCRLLEAIFKLIAWIRWPNSPGTHPAAIAACAIAYLSRSYDDKTLAEVPPSELALALKYISLRSLRNIYASEASEMPDFMVHEIADQPYDEIDYFADVARFILCYHPPTNDPRDAPSLNKAHRVLEEGIDRYRWNITIETFRRYWSIYGPSTPFLYVRRYHFKGNLILDPFDLDFKQSIDDFLLHRGALVEYLAMCRTAVQRMRERLDPRALGEHQFPTFPEAVVPIELEFAPLPQKVQMIMRTYGRADKRS